jgi:hypothetical protein
LTEPLNQPDSLTIPPQNFDAATSKDELLHEKYREPTSGLEPLTCSLRICLRPSRCVCLRPCVRLTYAVFGVCCSSASPVAYLSVPARLQYGCSNLRLRVRSALNGFLSLQRISSNDTGTRQVASPPHYACREGTLSQGLPTSSPAVCLHTRNGRSRSPV